MTTTVPPVVLTARPRRSKVDRGPSQRAAARTLRRTATPTTGRTWTRRRLPLPVVARAGVPVSEAVVSCSAVALLFVPVLLFTGGAAGTWITAAVSVAVVAYLVWARRVVVGESYVAVRQLGRYHVATVDHVRHLELKPTQRGGVLCLHTDDGRCMRLRRVETSQPAVAAALRTMLDRPGATRDPLVETLLGLPHDEGRTRHRYLADVVG